MKETNLTNNVKWETDCYLDVPALFDAFNEEVFDIRGYGGKNIDVKFWG